MNKDVKIPPAPTVYCPKDDKKVPIWYCLGSLTQGRERCSYLVRATVHGGESAEVECKWKPDMKFIGGGTITGFRFSRHDRVSGLVVEKEGEKKIVRIAFETKRGLFGHRIVGAHLKVEDYW